MQMEVIPSGNNVFLNFTTSSTFIVFLIELSTFFFFVSMKGWGSCTVAP